MNTIDELFHVGYTWDRHAEFMPRPIIITAMEICTPEVVDFLLNFGADLTKEHEGLSHSLSSNRLLQYSFKSND